MYRSHVSHRNRASLFVKIVTLDIYHNMRYTKNLEKPVNSSGIPYGLMLRLNDLRGII